MIQFSTIFKQPLEYLWHVLRKHSKSTLYFKPYHRRYEVPGHNVAFHICTAWIFVSLISYSIIQNIPNNHHFVRPKTSFVKNTLRLKYIALTALCRSVTLHSFIRTCRLLRTKSTNNVSSSIKSIIRILLFSCGGNVWGFNRCSPSDAVWWTSSFVLAPRLPQKFFIRQCIAAMAELQYDLHERSFV